MVRILVYSLVLGGFLMGLTGTLQYLQMDFFRSDMGSFFMNLMSGQKMNFTFNFSNGWVYATLYNPNYVGSYVALVLPVVIAVAVMDWGKIPKFWSVLAMVTTCLLIVTLLGSQSLTGCVGVIVSALFFVVFVWRRIVSGLGWKKIAAGAAGLVVFIGVMCLLFPDEIRIGVDKLFHPTEDYHVITSMLDTEKGLQVKTVSEDVFYLELTGETDNPFSVKGENGEELELQKERDVSYYTFTDSRFDNFRLYPTTATVDGETLTAVRIFNPTINKQWTIAQTDDGYQVFTAHKKLDKLEKIEAIGFEDNLHFGDKRGYIWSRTLPLLRHYLITGSGPNTFTEVFPNNDYVGKTNMNYDGVPVTKPHNLYLQIWVQTGLVSMIAFVLVFLIYFVSSIRLYYRGTLGIMEQIGIAIMIGCFGYMVTGLANDSTVSVAPVYWGLMGLGMAVNHLVRKNRTSELKRKEKEEK
jgi:O-antigen ligase